MSTKEYREVMADLLAQAEAALERRDKQTYDDCLRAIKKATIAWDPDSKEDT